MLFGMLKKIFTLGSLLVQSCICCLCVNAHGHVIILNNNGVALNHQTNNSIYFKHQTYNSMDFKHHTCF